MISHQTGKMNAPLCPLQWECSSAAFVVSPTSSHTLAAGSHLCSLVSDMLGKILPRWKQQEFNYWFQWLSVNWLTKECFCLPGGPVSAGCILTLSPSEGKPGNLPAPPFLALSFLEINSTCGAISLLWQVSDFFLGQDVIYLVKIFLWH